MTTRALVRKLILISQIVASSNNIADIKYKLGELTLDQFFEEKARIYDLYTPKANQLSTALRRIELGELT